MCNPCKYAFPAVLTLADAVLTLAGQPAAYWRDFAKADEAFPAFAELLHIHPAAFLAAALAWIAAYCLVIRALPRWPSLVVSVSFMTGHFVGCLTWLLLRFHIPFPCVLLLFPLFASAVVFLVHGVTKGQVFRIRSP